MKPDSEMLKLGARTISLTHGKWANLKTKRQQRIAAHVARQRAILRLQGRPRELWLTAGSAHWLKPHELLFRMANAGVHPGEPIYLRDTRTPDRILIFANFPQ